MDDISECVRIGTESAFPFFIAMVFLLGVLIYLSLLQSRESNHKGATPDDKAERCANADAVIRGRQVELELEVARVRFYDEQRSSNPDS